MSIRRFVLLAGVVLVGAAGIACLRPKPKLTTRHKTSVPRTIPDGQNASEHLAGISIFSLTPSETTSQMGIFNLSPEGQAALIGKMNDKIKPEELFKALARPIRAAPEDAGIVDQTVLTRRVVISIENKSSGTADRLATATIVLDISHADQKVEFIGWDKFASKYETVDLGRLQFTQSNTFDVQVDLLQKANTIIGSNTTPVSGSQQALGAEYITTQRFDEALALQQRYIVYSGILTSKTAKLIQQGVPGLDLSGNVAIDLRIKLPANDKYLIIWKASNLSAATPSVQYSFVTIPCYYNDPIKLKYQLKYTLRKVLRGDRTIIEGDDDVELVSGTTPEVQYLILSVEDQKYISYVLENNGKVVRLKFFPEEDRRKFSRGISGNDNCVLRFATMKEAIDFYDWLKRTSSRLVAGRDLLVGDDNLDHDPSATPLNLNEINAFSVKKTTSGRPCDNKK